MLARAAEDYAPFDLTFTTDSALYDSTSATSRMMVMFTPTDTASPGAGGVAKRVGFWANSTSSIRKCWVFNTSAKSAAEALSHELGHTLGLSHDGQLAGGIYYNGHGGGLSTPTSWCPIMGAGYYVNLTQFSKGEYYLANNTEDDLAIIAKAANNFGYKAATPAKGAINPLITSGSTFSVTGLRPTAESTNFYEFTTSGGRITATVRPTVTDTTYSDLDTRLDLVNVTSGTIVQTANDISSLSSTLSWNIGAPGTYRLKVSPTGTGDKPSHGLHYGLFSLWLGGQLHPDGLR